MTRYLWFAAGVIISALLAQEPGRIPMRTGNLECSGFPQKKESIHITCTDVAAGKVITDGDLKVPNSINTSQSLKFTHQGEWQEWSVIKDATDFVHWTVYGSGDNHASGTF
jgi:hypothetical protein